VTSVLNRAFWAILLLLGISASHAARADLRKSTAIFYGTNPPTNVLAQYRRIIVEADNITSQELTALRAQGGDVFAYLSIGETAPSRHWFKSIKAEWILGDNRVWDSKVMDLRATGWQQFVLNKLVTPLWEAGYRGLFIDTMDSFKLFATSDKQHQQHADALADLLQAIKTKYPDIRLIANRGFEVLPAIGEQLEAVAAESLYASWDNSNKRYQPTQETDQQWLLDQLESIQTTLNIDIIIIDYLPPAKRKAAKALAKRIHKQGFIPWVSIPSLDMMGSSNFEPTLNTALLLTNSQTEPQNPLQLEPYRMLKQQLQAEGITLLVHDIQSGMPTGHLAGRYQSIITAQPFAQQFEIYQNWLRRQQREGVHIRTLTADAAISQE